MIGSASAQTHASTGTAHLGSVISERRILLRLSQEELAERARISVRALRDIERGKTRFPHPESVRRLATALGMDPDQGRVLLQSLPRRLRRDLLDEPKLPDILPGSQPGI
ncbi:helix-turn-helix domain-containing protein [Nocardia sp. NPDC001965]